jgi:hypothetical protein
VRESVIKANVVGSQGVACDLVVDGTSGLLPSCRFTDTILL